MAFYCLLTLLLPPLLTPRKASQCSLHPIVPLLSGGNSVYKYFIIIYYHYFHLIIICILLLYIKGWKGWKEQANMGLSELTPSWKMGGSNGLRLEGTSKYAEGEEEE